MSKFQAYTGPMPVTAPAPINTRSQSMPVGGSLDHFFSVPNVSTVPRIAMSLDGLDKEGKTHYAIVTAPDPVCVISLDSGTDLVATKAVQQYKRDVRVMSIITPEPNPNVTRAADVDANDLALWRQGWSNAKDAGASIRADKSIRSLVIDTGTALFSLCMLAYLGKLKKIPQHMREEPNSDFTKFFNDLYKGRPDLNLIFLHQMKKQYVKSDPNSDEGNWNGLYERAGFNKMGFLVDISMRAGWDYTQRMYYTEVAAIQSTRWGGALSGQRMYGAYNNFGMLGMILFPETEATPDYWGYRP